MKFCLISTLFILGLLELAPGGVQAETRITGQPYSCMAGQKSCPDGGCVPNALSCQSVPGRRVCSNALKKNSLATCSLSTICDDDGLCKDVLHPQVCSNGKHCPAGSNCNSDNQCFTTVKKSNCLLNATSYGIESDRIGDNPAGSTDLSKLATYRDIALLSCGYEQKIEDDATAKCKSQKMDLSSCVKKEVGDKIITHDDREEVIKNINQSFLRATSMVQKDKGLSNTQNAVSARPQKCENANLSDTSWCASENFPKGNQKTCIGSGIRSGVDDFTFTVNPTCSQQKYFSVVTEYDETPDCRMSVVIVDPKNIDSAKVNSSTTPRHPLPVVIDAILAADGIHTPSEILDCYEKRHDERPCVCKK
jgi:hypothetical protein